MERLEAVRDWIIEHTGVETAEWSTWIP